MLTFHSFEIREEQKTTLYLAGMFKAYKNNTSKILLKINARKFRLPKNYFVIPLVVIRQRNLNFLQLLFAHAYITNL